jgi:hypothetical protein
MAVAKMTLGMLKKLAEKHGATVREDAVGWLDCAIEAPEGHIWASDQVHELVGSTNIGPKEWGWEMRAELAKRMEQGVEPCSHGECEWWGTEDKQPDDC